jgi:hypothetical protein
MLSWQTFCLICEMVALGIVLSVPIKAIYFKFDDEKELESDKKD